MAVLLFPREHFDSGASACVGSTDSPAKLDSRSKAADLRSSFFFSYSGWFPLLQGLLALPVFVVLPFPIRSLKVKESHLKGLAFPVLLSNHVPVPSIEL